MTDSKHDDDKQGQPPEPKPASDTVASVAVPEPAAEDTLVAAPPPGDDDTVIRPAETGDAPVDDPPGDGHGGEGPPTRRSLPVRMLLWSVKALALLMALVFLLAVLVLVFPYQYIAAPLATSVMEDYGWDIELTVPALSLLSGLEITDITVRPPKDFSHTPLKAKRLALHYSLWQILTDRRLVVRELALEQVELVYEDRGEAGTNLSALLAGFGGGETEPEPTPEPEVEESGGPGAPWWLEIRSLKLKNIGARMITPDESYTIRGLGLDGNGEISTGGDGASNLALYLDAGDADELTVRRSDIQAAVKAPLRIEVHQKDLASGTAVIHMPLALTGRREGVDLPATTLDLEVKARADRIKDTGAVEAFTLKLNDTVVADLSASVKRLFNNPAVSLAVKTLGVDLPSVQPLASLFVPKIALRGRIGLETSTLDARQSDIDAKRLPTGSVMIGIRKVDALLPSMNIDVRNLDGQLTLDLDPDAEDARGAYHLGGTLGLHRGRFPGASVSGLELTLAIGLQGLAQPRADISLGVRAGTVDAAGFSLPLKLDIALVADAAGGVLESLAVDAAAGKLLSIGVHASAKELGRSGRVKLSAKTGPVATVLAALPAGIAASLPKGLKAKGSVALKASAGWTLPWKQFLTALPPDFRGTVGGFVPAAQKPLAALGAEAPVVTPEVFSLPLHLKTQLSINGLDVALPESALSVKDGDITVNIDGRPAKLHVTGSGRIPSIVAGVRSIRNAALSIDAMVAPSSVAGDIGLTAGSVNDTGVPADIAELSLRMGIQAPLKRFAPVDNQAAISLTLGAEALRQGTPGKQNFIEELAMALNLVSGRHGGISLDGTIGAASMDSMAGGIGIEGVDGTIKATTTLDDTFSPTGATRFSFRLNGASVDTGDRLPFELEDNRVTLDLDSGDGMGQITLRSLRLEVPSLGLTGTVKGLVYPLVLSWKPFKMSSRPNADVDLKIAMDNPEALELPGPTVIRGNAAFNLGVALHGDDMTVKGDIGTSGFSVGMTSAVADARPGETRKPKSRHVFVEDLNLSIPFSQRLQIRPKVRVLAADTRSILGKQGSQTLYDPLREWSSHRHNVRLIRAGLREFEGDTLIRNVELNRLDMDLRYKDNVFRIDRMHLGFLGGDIIGQLAVQLLGDDPARPRLRFALQASGVNLGYLTLGKTKVGPETEVSALMETDVDIHSGDVGGRINITEISLSQLDKLLQFLDPTGTDPKIQKNRQLLSMASLLRPKVSLVSIWLEHQNLNMDINIESLPVIQGILQNILDNFRLRRYSIAAILKRYLPQPAPADTGTPPTATGISAETGIQENGP